MTILLALLFCISTAVAGDTGWDLVKEKILASKDYAFRYQYNGPSGEYRFSYAYSAPGVIREEILPGSQQHSGTIVFYDAARSTNYVTVRTGFIQLRRSTRSKDIADTSLVNPLLHQIVSKVNGCSGPSVSRTAEMRVFEFQGTQQHQLWVNDRDEIVRYRVSEKGKTVEELELEAIQWNTGQVPAL